jgi:hypothetical protein
VAITSPARDVIGERFADQHAEQRPRHERHDKHHSKGSRHPYLPSRIRSDPNRNALQ